MLQIRLTEGTLIKWRSHPRVHAQRRLWLQTVLSNLGTGRPAHRLLFKNWLQTSIVLQIVPIGSSIHVYHRQLQEPALLPQKLTLRETGETCEYAWKAQTQQWTAHYQLSLGSHMAQIWPLSHMSLGSKAQTRRENHGVTGWENKGEEPHKYVYFHPEAEEVAQRADSKEKPSLLGSVTSPRPVGPAKGGVWGRKGSVCPHSGDRNKWN